MKRNKEICIIVLFFSISLMLLSSLEYIPRHEEVHARSYKYAGCNYSITIDYLHFYGYAHPVGNCTLPMEIITFNLNYDSWANAFTTTMASIWTMYIIFVSLYILVNVEE